jgi:hypothetical protein
MPTVEEQLATLVGTWERARQPITAADATAEREAIYGPLDVPRSWSMRRRGRLAIAAGLVALVGVG